MNKILSIIVLYNGKQWIDSCLPSLINSSVHTDILVVDNLSTDGGAEYIEQKFPSVTVIRSEHNAGFAKANNVGMSYALKNKYDFVFLLNQDAWTEQNTIINLMTVFKSKPDAGIVSPIHLNGRKSTLDYGFASYMKSDYLMDLYSHSVKSVYSVPFVNAAGWLISRHCLETVGGFDTLLFHHYEEDSNYCQRVRYHGLKIYVSTECTICHDREQRDIYNYRGRKIWEDKNKYSFYKLDKGDINKNVNIKSLQIKAFIYYILNSLSFKFNVAQKYKEELSILKKINISRKINSASGPSWLIIN